MRRRAFAAVVLLAAWAAAGPAAAEPPRPPCAGPPSPDYPPAGAPPAVGAWFADELGETWRPDACLGWAGGSGLALVALAGRFDDPGGLAAVQARLGAFSQHTAILYWSVSRQTWRPLFAESWALAGADRDSRRGDFAPADMTPGSLLHFWQKPNEPQGGAVYRIAVVAADGRRLEAAETNLTPLTFLGLPLIPVDGQEARLWIEAEAPGRFRYYALSRLSGRLPFGLARASLVNRAVALFRHAAGVPTDREPPAAP